MSQWIYRIVPTRPEIVAHPTDGEAAVMAEHVDYLEALRAAGILILAGRAQQHTGVPEITIFEAPDEARARAVMQTDPAVSAGVMTAELFPYAVAVPRDAVGD